MKTIDFVEAQIRQFVMSKRPPKELRDQIDLGYSFENHVLIIFEIRSRWNNPSEKFDSPIAKARFITSRNIWKLYWMRASGKWEPYEPESKVQTIERLLKIIGEDEHHCFWG